MASEQTLKAVKLARGQEISAENQKKQSAQENHKGVFKVNKVVRGFQKEKKKKKSAVPNAVQSGAVPLLLFSKSKFSEMVRREVRQRRAEK